MAAEVITLNVTPTGDMPVLHLAQYDVNRTFGIALMWGEDEYVLPEGITCELQMRKTDSRLVTLAPSGSDDNVITFDCIEQMCTCPGKNIAQLALMDEDDNVIHTLRFEIEVQRDVMQGGLNSVSDIHNLETQITDICEDVLDDELPGKLNELVPPIVDSELGNYYTKSQVDTALSAKADSADLATVATTGDYDDLLNKPTIPAAQVNSDWDAVSGVAQILNKPVLLTQTSLDIDNRIKAIRTGNQVLIVIYSNVSFKADGKTLDTNIPEGFRTTYDLYFYAKIYDGSAYVDCILLFDTSGNITITNLFGGVITGANVFFLRNRSFAYYTE